MKIYFVAIFFLIRIEKQNQWFEMFSYSAEKTEPNSGNEDLNG